MVALRDPVSLVWDRRLEADDKEQVATTNSALQRLADERAIEINVSGIFAQSKLAWKLFRLSQSLQHRVVQLADALCICWNGSNDLGAILSGRALIETEAVISTLRHQTEKMVANKDVSSLNATCDKMTFSTRDKDILADSPELQSTNILTEITRLDHRLKGVADHYHRLSERCHPNYFGHVGMFSQLNTKTLTVKLRDSHPTSARSIFSSYLTVGLSEVDLKIIYELVPQVARIQSSA
ncbi:hypothetical protein [Rhizobium sp. 18065]|uniref:hypothetical protein n=1 Tax=Rhizobium sp. 18065 TaxID=2681411 RepID=UPI00135964E5|nr:hypothetical protein [Rhizobium sp. 18065]